MGAYSKCSLSFCHVAMRISWRPNNCVNAFRKVILNAMQDVNDLQLVTTEGQTSCQIDNTGHIMDLDSGNELLC
ncbi:hypothetical protein TNCV_4600641 [Trichonephila clavipes]|nr:hypothetical protein TNCV_4600641 [Trichonephila clavipes]